MATSKSRRSRFTLDINAATGKRFVPFLRTQVQRAFQVLLTREPRVALREMNIAVVGEKRMSELHRQFLSIAGPTDVLTFPIETDARGKTVSGDVVICVPVAQRQSAMRGIPVRLELLLYAIHGMLHLCGHDDRTTKSFRDMHRTEDVILIKLGLGAVFDRAPRIASRTEKRR